MDALRWEEIRRCFETLVELDSEARTLRLAQLRTDNADLARAVESMLASDEVAPAELDSLESIFAASGHPGESSASCGPPPDPFGLSGRSLSHFHVLEPLGTGGMGFVYRAEDTRLRRPVALKFLLPQLSLDSAARERFLQEARSAGGLDHPNLCTIYDVEESDGRLFLSMPLYAGETLKERLAREGALPAADAIAIARQIAQGLAFAHRAGIVHRDLKPGNVMLLPGGTVKILDFGLAKARDVSLTEAGRLPGTVAYMAPEQLLGQPVDARADLWALGVVLYEMLTGERPFGGEQEQALVHSVLNRAPRPAGELRPSLPRAIQQIVTNLLEKDPANRAQSSQAVLDALHGLPDDSGSPGFRWSAAGGDASGTPRSRRSFGKVALLTAPGTLLVGAAAAAVLVRVFVPPESFVEATPSIAVLPPEDLRTGGESDLARGLQRELASKLAGFPDLRVISPQSVQSYVGTTKPLRLIGEELGAEYLLGGSIRGVGGKVRLDLSLTAAPRDVVVSAFHHEASDTLDLFRLQSEVSRAVLQALQIELTAGEQARLTKPPTENTQAFDLYLRGRDYEDSRTGDSRRLAARLYAQAADLDPDFALAHARNAIAQAEVYRFGASASDRWNSVQAERVRVAAETAMRLDPELPEAHLAMGAYWYLVERDFPRALREIDIALEGLPNEPDAHALRAYVHRRQGRWEEALAGLQRAMELDPRNPHRPRNVADTFWALGRYGQAIRAFDRVLVLAPEAHKERLRRGYVFIDSLGTTDSVTAALAQIPPDWDEFGFRTYVAAEVALLDGRPADAILAIEAMRPGVLEAQVASGDTRIVQIRARAYEQLGDSVRAHADHELVRTALEQARRERPMDPHIHADLAIAYAALGHRAEALRELREAEAIHPPDRDAWDNWMEVHAAQTHVRLGDTRAALDLLIELNRAPNHMSSHMLRLDRRWDRLRDEPQFQRLASVDPRR